jgi:glucose/arabinose dehydrogenase
MKRRIIAVAVILMGVGVAAGFVLTTDGGPPRPPEGFIDEVVLRGLDEPLGLAFARDGSIVVAEKDGKVKVFPRLGAARHEVFADLGPRIFRLGDRGLFGLALDPAFPAKARVYVLYTFDGPAAASEPLGRRRCPALFDGGCVVSGRVSLLEPGGRETVLIAGWCQQFPSHGVGDLAFGADGALYASSGEGASYSRVDTGVRRGCGDPPGEGGALRAQDALTAGDPLGLSGAVTRIDLRSGKHRLVAFGLRNPFRFALRPGTTELWIGDVGSSRADELNVTDGAAHEPRNFGWPCYEGRSPLRSYDEADVPLCERLYADGGAVEPEAAFDRDEPLLAGDPCGSGTQALSGLSFYEGGSYPARYQGALFLADYARRCIWAMLPDDDGRPDPSRIELFRTGVAGPVKLVAGPGGDLFYLDFSGGAVHRLRYAGAS